VQNQQHLIAGTGNASSCQQKYLISEKIQMYVPLERIIGGGMQTCTPSA
jgi:hypothetical protein